MNIHFDHVTFAYEKPILKDFCCSFDTSGIYGILGKSGCGKTTFFKLLSGLLQPQSGTVTVTAEKISFLFQENRLLPWFTVLDNLLSVTKDREHCLFLLDSLGLSGIAYKFPSMLSGGMCRRVALAKALAYDGSILLLDEPFTGIDLEQKQAIYPFLQQQIQGKLCLLITHSPEELHALATACYFLQKHCFLPASFVK